MFGAAGRGRRWWWRDIVVAWPSAVVAHVSAEEPTAHPNTHLPTNRVSKGLAALQWVWIASSGGGNRDVRLNLWRPVTGRRQGGPSGRVKRIRQQLRDADMSRHVMQSRNAVAATRWRRRRWHIMLARDLYLLYTGIYMASAFVHDVFDVPTNVIRI